MDNGGQSSKKARVEPELPNAQVKQELAVLETNGGGAGAVVAAGRASRVEITVRIDMTVLHGPVCFLPLKPPVFQCEVGHSACSSCHGKLPGNRCATSDHGGVYVRSPKIHYPNAQYGCRSYVTYYEVTDHQNACLHAPCSCTEPGRGFVGFSPTLLGHLAAVHPWPVHRIHYGKVLNLRVLALKPQHLLVEEGDELVFLLTVAALGAASAVSVVCVRASAGAGPWFVCKMWANAQPATASSEADSVLVAVAEPGLAQAHGLISYDYQKIPTSPRSTKSRKKIWSNCMINKKFEFHA